METLKKYYLFFSIALVLVGVALDYISSELAIQYFQVKSIDGDKIVTKDIYKYSPIFPIIKPISTSFFAIGISVFVAFFITRRIEEYEKEEKNKELELIRQNINKDVVSAVFKTLIPEELHAVIKKDILTAKLIRRNAKWIYDFSLKEENKINLRQTFKSELHNIGDTIYDKPFKFIYATGDYPEVFLESATCESNKEIIASYNAYNSCENKNINVSREQEKGIGEKVTVLINLTIPSEKYVVLTLVTSQEYSKKEIIDGYFTRHAIINIELIATYPENYCFNVFPSFSSELRLTSKIKGRSIHELKGAVLPFQGIMYTLKPEN